MRLLLAAIIAAQILVLAPATAAPWVKFTDPNGQFSVMFPVAPTAKTGGTWGPGKNFPITAYMVMKGTARLVLMVVDMNLEGSNADAKAAIDSKESTLLQAMTAETVKVVTLDGVNGRYLAGAKKGGGREIDQIFSIKNHLYQVIAMTSAMATAQDIEDAKQFSESFHFGD
jgi:hypothetical protein